VKRKNEGKKAPERRERKSDEESLFKGGFSVWVREDFMVCAFFLFPHSTSSFHPMENQKCFAYTTTYTQFFPHRRFLLMFLSPLSPFSPLISAVFISILLPFNQLLILFFFFLFSLLFFRGEIIHQFLFSLHSCANNDRKKLLLARAPLEFVFRRFPNGFFSACWLPISSVVVENPPN
jgi:hypothetical protein